MEMQKISESLQSTVFFFFLNYYYYFFFTFCSCSAACGISVHQSGIEPVSAAGKMWNLNYWTARQVLQSTFMQAEGQTSRFKT